MQLLAYGEENRSYRATTVHEHSSRSHTIFRIQIERKYEIRGPKDYKVRYSELNLVDLAGSERLSELESNPDVQGETAHINKSLFTLSHVINKLAENNRRVHIPYRDSKLTRILQNSLGGNSLTAVICTISPASVNFFQTLSTLRFASRASTVALRATENTISVKSALVQQLELTIEKLHQ